MGHAGQQIVAAALRTMGYMLEGEETTVEYGPLVGHVDGLLRGHDLGERLAVWDNKVKGAWAYRNLLKNGIRGDAEIYMQIQCYILATGAELALVTVVPADLNTNISLMRQYKVEGDPVINRMVYTPDTEAQELAVLRAQELNVAIKMGVLPSREFNPDAGKYPCTYCPFLEQCQIDGAGDYTVSPIPSEWFDA